MSRFFKKIVISFLVLSIVCLHEFTANHASAAAGNQDVEKSFEFICKTQTPFSPDPAYTPVSIDFKASFPERVQPGEEFNLKVISSMYLGILSFENPTDEAIPVGKLEGPNFKISSENETNTVHTFGIDYEIIAPPRTSLGEVSAFFTPEDGLTVGPFKAGSEGEVVLKVDQFMMNMVISAGFVMPVSIAMHCNPPEDQEFLLGTVEIDQPPVITLNGDNPVIVKQGDPYVEPGATASDNVDGDLTDQIEISGDVDTSKIGTYTVTYTVSDSVGNVTTVERTVNVVEPFGSWYTGEGPPSDELGSNGDSYLDITTGDVYKRDPNTWTKVGNIKGGDGKQGSKIHTGSGAPKADLGDVGDLYVDTKTGDVYEKTADGWVKVANLQGPGGPSGPQGPKGTDGTGGSSGDGTGTGKKGSGTSKGDGEDKGTTAKGGKLPKTATSLPAFILVGTLLVIVGAVLFLRRQQAMEK